MESAPPSTPQGAPARSRSGWINLRAALLAALAGGLVWRLVWAAREDIFTDDAYYYTVVARNLAETGRSTFDGASLTNGYHPLFLLVQWALAAVVGPGASPLAFYGVLVSVSALSVVVTAVLVALRLPSGEGGVNASRLGPGRGEDTPRSVLVVALALTLAVALWTPRLGMYMGGMEATLLLPLGVAMIWLLGRERYRGAGVVAGFLALARLDALVYVVIPLALWYAVRELREGGGSGRASGLRRAGATGLALAAPAATLVGVYMAVNQWRFGHPIPIHGTLKSTFPVPNVQWDQLLHGPLGPAQVLMSTPSATLLSALAALVLLGRRGRAPDHLRSLGLVLALVTGVQLASFVLFQRWVKPSPAWYLALPSLTATGALALGLAHRLGTGRFRAVVLLLVAGIALWNARAAAGATRYALRTHGFATQVDPVLRFMESAAAGVEAGSGAGAGRGAADSPGLVWASTDCGKMAFWSGQRVVNLDGLVNDRGYQEYLGRGELAAYLRERQVRYLVVAILGEPGATREPMYLHRVAPDVFDGTYHEYRFFVHSYLYGVPSDTLRIPRRAEVWRSEAGSDGGEPFRWVAFDLVRAGI